MTASVVSDADRAVEILTDAVNGQEDFVFNMDDLTPELFGGLIYVARLLTLAVSDASDVPPEACLRIVVDAADRFVRRSHLHLIAPTPEAAHGN